MKMFGLLCSTAALMLAPAAAAPALAQTPPPAPPPKAGVAQPERDPASLEARVRARLKRLVDEDGFQGVVRVDVDGKPVIREGIGMADPARGRPFRPDTQIEIASIGKSFTAAAILKLRDQGKLDLQDPLSKFFPDAPADKAPITLFQLLTGSSGLPAHEPRNTGLDRAGFEAWVMQVPLAAKPGERFIYSNAAFNLLAAIVERVSGRDYLAFLHDEILAPAHLTRTGYADAYDAVGAATNSAGVALPQAAWGGATPDWNIIGAGGLVSTADEMLAWHDAFMAGRVVSERSVREATTGWIDQGPNAPPGKYGFGLGIMDHPAYGKTIWHNGGDLAFTSFIADIPGHRITLFVSTNCRADATLVGFRLMRAMFAMPDPQMMPPPPPSPGEVADRPH